MVLDAMNLIEDIKYANLKFLLRLHFFHCAYKNVKLHKDSRSSSNFRYRKLCNGFKYNL